MTCENCAKNMLLLDTVTRCNCPGPCNAQGCLLKEVERLRAQIKQERQSHDDYRLSAERDIVRYEELVGTLAADLDGTNLQLSEARGLITALVKDEDEGVYLCDENESCKCAMHSARRFIADSYPIKRKSEYKWQDANLHDGKNPCGCVVKEEGVYPCLTHSGRHES